MSRNTHDRVRDHEGFDLDSNIKLDGATDSYADQDILHNVIADLDTRAGTGGGGGLADLITGDDSTFATSNGAWTNSGGTLTWDSAYEMANNAAGGSLKHATTTSGQFVELAIAGTFLANTDYWVVLWLSNETTSGSFSGTTAFGLIGTDSASNSTSFTLDADSPVVGDGRFMAVATKWRPTADRTGVKVRFTNGTSSASTWHIGMARCWQTPIIGTINAYGVAYTPANNGSGLSITPIALSSGVQIGTQFVELATPNYLADFFMTEGSFNGEADIYMQAVHTAGDFADAGLQIVVGEDFVGLFISERDSNTVQIYPDASGGYDVELKNRSTDNWKIVSADDSVKKLLIALEERKGQSASATITSGNTSVTVTHGAGYTPAAQDICIHPINNPTNDAGWWWVDTITATQFTIRVNANPGAAGASFAWRVDR